MSIKAVEEAPQQLIDAEGSHAEEHRAAEEGAMLLQPLETEKAAPGGPSSTAAAPTQDSLIGRARRALWESGTACMAFAAFFFSFAAALVKIITNNGQRPFPVFEIVVIRSLLSMTMTFVTAAARKSGPVYGQRRHWPMLAARGLIGAAAMTVFYESLLRLPLADSITILFCNPAVCSVFAWILLGEAFGWFTVVGLAFSLGGVVLVARPPFMFGGAEEGQEWSHDRAVGMILAVTGVFFTSGAYLAIRIIGHREPPLTIAMWFHTSALVSNAMPLMMGLPSWPVLPTWMDCLCLAGIGCCSFCAQLMINRGFQILVAVKAAAVNYTQVIWAHVLGFLFFGESVPALGVAGAGLIAVGVLTVNADKTHKSVGGSANAAAQQQQQQQAGSGAAAAGEEGGEDGEAQQQQQQQQQFVDQHGRLKAKSSFKALLPGSLKLGGWRGVATSEEEAEGLGAASGSSMERGLLQARHAGAEGASQLAHLGRRRLAGEGEAGGEDGETFVPTPLQPLLPERPA